MLVSGSVVMFRWASTPVLQPPALLTRRRTLAAPKAPIEQQRPTMKTTLRTILTILRRMGLACLALLALLARSSRDGYARRGPFVRGVRSYRLYHNEERSK